MHKIFIALPSAMVMIFQSTDSFGQNFGTLHVGEACSYFGEKMPKSVSTFGSISEATRVISRIVKANGLAKNFEIEAASVPNAAAVVKGSKRYILYNPNFITKTNRAAGTKWAAISIMAHEVGHHLNGHTLQPGGSRPKTELEADLFSGYVLQKMGAEQSEAIAAMEKLGSVNGSSTHPAKSARLAAITAGWQQACDADSSCGSGNTTRNDDQDTRTSRQPLPDDTQTTRPRRRNTQVAYTDRCNIRGEPVLVTRDNKVVSPRQNNAVVGRRVGPNHPNCMFMLTSRASLYCVARSGQVYFGTSNPVGVCRPY